jgi:hypothetical protein
MRIARQIGLLLVAVCALSAVAVSSASAILGPLFLFHGTGGRLLASAGTTQELSIAGRIVQCKALSAEGTIKALRALTILVTVRYTSCEIPAAKAPAEIHPIQFLIDANGLVKLENNVLILAPALGAPQCVITLPAAKNQGLNSVKFENTTANGGILLLSNVNKITGFGTGGGELKLCEFAEASEGTNTGTIHVTADGGLLKWDLNS